MITVDSLSTDSNTVFRRQLEQSGMGGMMNILFAPLSMTLEIFSHLIIILTLLPRFLSLLFQKLTIGWFSITEFFKGTTSGII